MSTIINLNGLTAEQLAAWITFKQLDKNVLRVYSTEDFELHIVYMTASSYYVCVKKYDERGRWIKTEFYLSYDPSCNKYNNYVTEQKNPNYDFKKSDTE
jgi:hypothetical protein